MKLDSSTPTSSITQFREIAISLEQASIRIRFPDYRGIDHFNTNSTVNINTNDIVSKKAIRYRNVWGSMDLNTNASISVALESIEYNNI